MRVISLLPSATEIVCAVGAAKELIGVSHECDFPHIIRGRPVLTSARIGHEPTSAAIDAAVRSVVQDALSIYRVDERLLASLEPDLIVTQDLCEVCAVSLDDVRSAVARLARRDQVSIVSLRPTRLEHVLADVVRVGAALDRAEEASAVRTDMQRRISRISERGSTSRERPRVVSLEWLDPLMLGGTWMPELIELAGGTAIGPAAGELAPTVDLDALVALEPDVVLVKPCGFPIERTMSERPLVETLAARLPRAKVYVSDGNAFFNRPGPRLVESLEIMAACVQPAIFPELRTKHADAIVPIA
jgi:iron complex transport system substrate-binding protein